MWENLRLKRSEQQLIWFLDFFLPMLQRVGLSAAVIRYYYILMIGSRRGKLCQAVKIWAGDNLGCCCCSFRQFLTKWDFLPFEEALCCVWLQQQLVSHDPGLGQLMDQTEIEAGAREARPCHDAWVFPSIKWTASRPQILGRALNLSKRSS